MSVWTQTESMACPGTVFRGQESIIPKSSLCPLPVLLVDFITADECFFSSIFAESGEPYESGENEGMKKTPSAERLPTLLQPFQVMRRAKAQPAQGL